MNYSGNSLVFICFYQRLRFIGRDPLLVNCPAGPNDLFLCESLLWAWPVPCNWMPGLPTK